MPIFAPLLTAAAIVLCLQPETRPDSAAAKSLTIRVVGQDGKPAAGVLVGSNMYASYRNAPDLEPHLSFSGQQSGAAQETGADGELTVPQDFFFYGDKDTRTKTTIAWTKDRALMGMVEVPRPLPAAPIEVTLAPACRVTVKTTSKGLEGLGRTLTWSNVYLSWGATRPMASDSMSGEQVFYAPPGKYRLNAYGTDADSAYADLTIEPGEKSRTLTLDLPATRIAQLVGKPAPEFSHIKGWRNGGPVTLADLRGKVVLLDFWGYWCGPCVHSMPELMDLHDRFKDQGLIIIAVHDASAADIEDMNAKTAESKEGVWKGRDLPFLVALDGLDKPLPPDIKPYGSGVTTEAYGISAFPTQVLIDRDGKVVGTPRKGQIEEMLKVAAGK